MFKRYEKELVGKFVSDPLGTRVWFMDYNFPKLIQLHFRGTKNLRHTGQFSIFGLHPQMNQNIPLTAIASVRFFGFPTLS